MRKYKLSQSAVHHALSGEKRLYIMGYSSIGLMLLIATLMFCPPVRIDHANATTTDNTRARAATSTISVSLGGDVTTGSNAVSGNGEFSYGSTALNVTTNNKTGYKLYLNSGNNRTTLKNESDTNISQTINSLAQNTAGTSMTGNTWGYALSSEAINASSTFRAVSATSTEIDEQTTASTSGQTFRYNLGFGAHVDNTLPAGSYTNTVLVSVIANPLPPDISDINYMQEMTPEICSSMIEDKQYQLTDSRDNQKYYVAKMKDGNCWMTQNLALDITTAGLKASDTDISADWNSKSTYPPVRTSTEAGFYQGDHTQTHSLNMGQWVLGATAEMQRCSTGTISNYSECTKIGVVQVNDSWSPTFEAKEMVFNVPDTDYTGQTIYSAIDYVNKAYDPHYLIGNYYQWNTATAGTGGTITSGDAKGSICPKNWQLPAGNTSATNLKNKSYASLLSKYGITTNITGSTNGVTYNVTKSPIYITRGGLVSTTNGAYGNAKLSGGIGNYAEYYTSTANYYYNIPVNYTGYLAYHFSVDRDNIEYDDTYRFFQKTIRCVAR